jgi:phosphoribosyl 1,2-cyclic phosphate phosphodiesterase
VVRCAGGRRCAEDTRHDTCVHLRFLGTGASGGTSGKGRSGRRESSLLISNGTTLLLDVTRDFSTQAQRLRRIDGVLLTHGHRDAIGGLPQLRRWWLQLGDARPIDIFLNAATAQIIRGRYRRLDHCRLHVLAAGQARQLGAFSASAVWVPHAREPRFETYAWRMSGHHGSVVYASDVAYLTPELERFCAGATILILDGAMWRRRLFSHLTIDDALPKVCSWAVGSIVLTQIGRSAPPHPRLQREVVALCPRASAAYDGLVVTI